MGTRRIHFDPNNAQIRAFLTQIGVSKKLCDKGIITKREVESANISWKALQTIAGLSRNDVATRRQRPTRFHLSANEASQGLRLLTQLGTKGRALFDKQFCLAFSQSVEVLIHNLLKIPTAPYDGSTAHDVALETTCRANDLAPYGPGGLIGIHFTDRTAGAITTVGQGVVFVRRSRNGGASAVLINLSRDGSTRDPGLVSAYHVFFTDDGAFRSGQTITVHGKKIRIVPSMVVKKSATHDRVTIRLPKHRVSKRARLLKMATRPAYPGEQLTVIGFPKLSKGQRRRTYSTARAEMMADGALRLHEQGWHGDSGGAAVNDKGEVVAVMSRFDTKTRDTHQPWAQFTPDHAIGESFPSAMDPMEVWLYETMIDVTQHHAFDRTLFHIYPALHHLMMRTIRDAVQKRYPEAFGPQAVADSARHSEIALYVKEVYAQCFPAIMAFTEQALRQPHHAAHMRTLIEAAMPWAPAPAQPSFAQRIAKTRQWYAALASGSALTGGGLSNQPETLSAAEMKLFFKAFSQLEHQLQLTPSSL